MALIKCSECGKEVSDKASACPNCGFPISRKSKKTFGNKSTDKNILLFNSVLGVFGVLMLLAVLSSSNGIPGNFAATVAASSLLTGAICSVVAIRKKNKMFFWIWLVMYAIVMTSSVMLISNSIAYLVLEIFVACAGLLTVKYAKESRII